MTKRKPIEKDSRAVIVLVELIKAKPGIFLRDLMAESGYSISHTKNALSCGSGAGLVSPVYTDGCKCGWYTQDLAKPLIERWKQRHEIARNESLSRQKQRAATHAAAKAEKARQEAARRAALPMTARDRIAIMSKRPEGISAAAIMAEIRIPLNSQGKHCRVLVQRGRIFKADRQGARMRWFDTAERAKAWAAMPPMDPSEWVAPGVKAWANPGRKPLAKKNQEARTAAREVEFAQRQADRARAALEAQKAKRRKVVVRNVPAIKPPPGVAPSVHIPKPAPVVTVDYSGAKLTICPSPGHDPRYQAAPGAVVVGEFSRQWQQLRAAA